MIDQEEIQSILQCLEHVNDLWRPLCDKADEARELGRLDQALAHCDAALHSARRSRNSNAEAAILMHRWAVQISDHSDTRLVSLKAGLQDCAQARGALEGVNNSYGVVLTIAATGLTHQELGLEYDRQHNYSKGKEAFQSALDAYQEVSQMLVEVRRRLTAQSKYEKVDECQELASTIWHKIQTVGDLYASSVSNARRVPVPFHEGFLRLFALPVKGRIAAGVPISVSDDVTSYTTANMLMIEDAPYAILVGPGKSSEVKLDFTEFDYCLTGVEGDSMDKAGIQSGDYVLIRKPKRGTLAPDDGDVVAAVIKGEDRKATLKWFKKSGARLSLNPDSTNPKHQPHEISAAQWDQKVEVAGVMTALLQRRQGRVPARLELPIDQSA